MERHDEMGVYIKVDDKVYQAHYKFGTNGLCRSHCDCKIKDGACMTKGYQRKVCSTIDCYWREMK